MAKSSAKLLDTYRDWVLKALVHLEYSHAKVQSLPLLSLDEEQLETWESYTSRFSRVVDLFLTKYLKARVLGEDPAFDGSLRDLCNAAEKKGWIDSADAWVALRELRNATAHEYADADLGAFFDRIRREAARVLALRTLLK